MRLRNIFLIGLLSCALAGQASAAPLAGDAAAVASAKRLLAFVGGSSWSQRTLIVEETVYQRSGAVAHQQIARDFTAGTRVLTLSADDGLRRTEVLSPSGGWSSRDAVVTRMEHASLEADLQGLKQEPYYIYHRLALGGDGLKVVLADEGRTLEIQTSDGAQLCWFNLNGKGAPIGWGNIFNGRTVQHYYGPYVAMGGATFPKWGSAHDGGFRFEYTGARFSREAASLPAMPQ